MALNPTRLGAFAGPGRSRYLLAACGLLAGLAVATATLWSTLALRQRDFAHAQNDLKSFAFVLASELDDQLQAAELTQRNLIDVMRRRGIDTQAKFVQLMATREVHDELRSRVAGLPSLNGLALISVRGNVINLARSWPVQGITASDRDYFQALRAHPERDWFIGRPMLTRVDNRWTTPFARKFRSADGTPIGYVATGLDFSQLEQSFSQVRLNEPVAFTIYRRDGMLLARYPRVDPQIGRRFGDLPDFQRVTAALGGRVVTIDSRIDGRRRMIAARPLQHYGLFVAVGMQEAALLHGWRAETGLFVSSAGVIEALLLIGTVLGIRQLATQERAHAAETAQAHAEAALTLAQERQRSDRRFNVTLNNMRHGVCMFERSGGLVVANRSFHALFNLTPEAARPGISYFELTEQIVAAGMVSPEDMMEIRARRMELIERDQLAHFELPLTDGRVISVMHQPAPDYWLATYEDVTERYVSEAKMAHMAQHDALTGMPNRARFREKLETVIGQEASGQIAAVLLLDLDQFKSINDTLGHRIGDILLQAVGRRLAEELRHCDMVARLGGDEFAILASNLRQPADATALAQRLIALLAAPFDIEGNQISAGVSIGIALTPQDAKDCDQLLRCADLALYRAKSDGRGICRLFHAEMDAHMQARRALELDLRRALQQHEFELFYQPFVALPSETVVGFEALLRWRHPQRGLVPPDAFIPLAEEIGAIVPIGEWVMQQACRDAVSWPRALRVAVNLSPVQFRNADLVSTAARALQLAGLPADRLEVEITETVMMEDTQATLATLHALRDRGVRIAMDDFGTGYSSLGYLRRFPFDRLKIDKSFVRELGRQSDSAAIVRAVARMSSELGLATTAEGVETREQLAAVAAAGCREVQGFLFSPPVPITAIPALLRDLDAGRDAVEGREKATAGA